MNPIHQAIRESIAVKEKMLADPAVSQWIENTASTMMLCLQKGGKIIFAGNGGSMADSMHLAAEFVSKLCKDRRPLPSVALATNNSAISAIGNDYGYKHVFARELEAIAHPDDVAVLISTSGNSENILEAALKAKSIGLKVFGLSGESGGKLKEICPTLCVPSKDVARIQENHILVGHLLCGMSETPFLG